MGLAVSQRPTPEANIGTAPTRREMLGYAQIGAFVLLLLAAGIAIVWFVFGLPDRIDLGRTTDFPPDTPIQRSVTLRDSSTLLVWVVYTQDRWLVLDARVRFRQGCFVQLQPVAGLFEDPCSGAKFSITGEFVDPYHGFAGMIVQDLDQYPPDIRDDHVFIDPNRIIHAQPFVAPGM